MHIFCLIIKVSLIINNFIIRHKQIFEIVIIRLLFFDSIIRWEYKKKIILK